MQQFDHEKLDAYGIAIDFVISAEAIAQGATRGEGHGDLADQLRRASTSISTGNDPSTLGADKGYDTKDFVAACRERGVTPHVAKNEHAKRSSAIDDRTTRHSGYAASLIVRRRVEQIFGWMKSVGGLRRSRWRGKARTQLAAYLVGAAYNLLRIAKLVAQPA